MRYSMVSEERTKLEQAPPPQQQWSHRRAPWWAGWVLALLGSPAAIWFGNAVIGHLNKQTTMLTEIQTSLRLREEADKTHDSRLDRTEQRLDALVDRNRTSESIVYSGLKRSAGIEPPRGAPAETEQVKFQPTANAKKPLKPVGQDGRELELPAVR